MNHSELIAKIAEATELNRGAADRVVKAVVAAMLEAFSAGAPVRVVDLGAFEVVARPARSGRNPRTGETITIAAGKAVRFRPGQAVRNAVNPRRGRRPAALGSSAART